ncbi:MAG TPA: hypothetical protein VN862_02390 [Candidatus Acidoferrales bacterium]|nr:hypothetical protein [Candidatus Acidoferrales bacterium]
MAHFLIVTGKVKDFKTWKASYDDHINIRKEFGLAEHHVLHGTDDPNEIVVMLKASDLNRAKAFLADPKVQEVISKSGVVGKPQAHFLSEA